MSRLTLGKDCHQYLIEEKLKANVRKLNITQLVHVCVCSVAQSCPTLCNPMDCSLSGSSVQGIFPGKNTGVGCHFLLQGSFLTQGVNPCPLHLLHCLGDSLPLHRLVNFIVGLYRSASQYLCCRNLYAGQEATVRTGHGLKLNIQKTKIMASGPITFMANRWGNNGNSDRLYFLGLPNHCRW